MAQVNSIIPKKNKCCKKCGGRMFTEVEPEIMGGRQKFCVICGFREYPAPLPKVQGWAIKG